MTNKWFSVHHVGSSVWHILRLTEVMCDLTAPTKIRFCLMKSGNKWKVTVTNKNINWIRQFAPSSSNLFSNAQFSKWPKYQLSQLKRNSKIFAFFTWPESYTHTHTHIHTHTHTHTGFESIYRISETL